MNIKNSLGIPLFVKYDTQIRKYYREKYYFEGENNKNQSIAAKKIISLTNLKMEIVIKKVKTVKDRVKTVKYKLKPVKENL